MFTEKRTGSLIYDEKMKRMDIRFGLEEYYGGLHCGTGMEVMLDGKWVPTREVRLYLTHLHLYFLYRC